MLSDAEKIYEEILRRQPSHHDAPHLLGVILVQTHRAELGVAMIGKAIKLNPRAAGAHNNLGMGLLALERFEEAVVSYGKAIVLDPGYAEAYNNRGNALRAMRRCEEALVSYDKAIALKPDYAEAHNNRGAALYDLRRYEVGLASYNKAIALNRNYAAAYSNRGVTLRDLRCYEEALISFDKAIALRPGLADGQWNKSVCLLQLGRFERGWAQYEWRRKLDPPLTSRAYKQTLWLGKADVAGKTVFLHWEQGFGDTIQFCRYAKLVKALGAQVMMSVQDAVFHLLRQMEPAIQILGERQEPSAFDYHCPLMSLLLAMGTTLETMPSEPRYLAADARLRAEWAARLPLQCKPRIRLVWRGRASHKDDRNRSMDLAALLPALRDDAEWICLQKKLNTEDATLLARGGGSTLLDLRDFSDTAALVDLVNLVITVDTSVAHLAGAMGKPVWILLAYNSDWRWLADRRDSPWYPSARLFRQQEIGNWGDVISQVRRELHGVIDGGVRA
jgi:hypothetical protein